jgi:hypothetical protein
VAGQTEFDAIARILGEVLTEAWARLDRRGGPASAAAPEAPVAPAPVSH